VVVSVAIIAFRPFVNADQVAFAPADGGGADATYVGTGLLPIRLQAHDGGHVNLGAGHVGTVHVAKTDDTGRLRVRLTPAIPFWFWIALAGPCFLPALWSTRIGVRRQRMPA
jgi:hypothetical protein